MKTSVEPLEGNKVKVSVEVAETDFEAEINAAFRRIAREVRIPGFRPGKAPRRILEMQLGSETGRQEALRHALPEYYAQAVREHDVDVIAPPEIDITNGEEEGPVSFDAVVEVRPVVVVAGYQNLRISVDPPEATDEEIDAQVDRMRSQNAELATVERPAADDDHVRIDISGSQDGETLSGLTAEDYLYQVGSGAVVAELDEALRGASAGDEVSFTADHPDPEEEPVNFEVTVKEVSEQVLPELTDEWTAEESEFDTVEELRADLRRRAEMVKRFQGQMQLRQKTTEALAVLVTEDVPDSLLGQEVNARLQDMAQRVSAQGMDFESYLESSGTDPEKLMEDLREQADEAIRVDLALRAVAEAEEVTVSDDELDAEIIRVAEQANEKPNKVRKQLDRDDQLPLVRSDVRRRKALDWLMEHVEVVDEQGNSIDRSLFDVTDDFPGAENEPEQEETEAGEEG